MPRILIPLTLLLTLSACTEVVHKFDKRITKKYHKAGFTEGTLTAEESDINYHYFDNKKEDRPTIIFVHGFGGDGKISWWEQVKELHEDYRIIVPDLLWFGQSYSSEEPTLKAQIDALHQLIEAKDLEEVHLVGISYGGFIVLGHAHSYPDRIKTLTIVDSPGPVITDEEIAEFCRSVGVDDVKGAFIPESEEDVERLMNFSFYDPPKLTSGIREATIGVYFSKYPEQQAKLLDELPSNRTWMREKTVDVPTLILWGKDDEVFTVDQAKRLRDVLDAQLEVIPEAGHALPGEKPEEFNEILRRFIEVNVPGRPSTGSG